MYGTCGIFPDERARVEHITSQYITLHCVTLRYRTVPDGTVRYADLVERYITSHYITLQYITLRYRTSWNVSELRWSTLHYITLQYITVHCVTGPRGT